MPCVKCQRVWNFNFLTVTCVFCIYYTLLPMAWKGRTGGPEQVIPQSRDYIVLRILVLWVSAHDNVYIYIYIQGRVCAFQNCLYYCNFFQIFLKFSKLVRYNDTNDPKHVRFSCNHNWTRHACVGVFYTHVCTYTRP